MSAYENGATAAAPRSTERRWYLLIAVIGSLAVAAALWLFDTEGRIWQLATGFRQVEEPAAPSSGPSEGSRDRDFGHRAVEPK